MDTPLFIFAMMPTENRKKEIDFLSGGTDSHYDNSQYQAYFTKIELPEYDTYVGIIALAGDSGFENYLRYLEIY